MKTRSFTQQYGYIAVSLMLAFVCTIPVHYAVSNPDDADHEGNTWEGWAWVRNDGGHLSGNMAISTTWHDWGAENTLTEGTVTVNWECQNSVTKEFGHRNPWDEMKRLGSVTIPAGEYREYQYSHLANTCDWIAEPGNYTIEAYTAARVAGDGFAETEHIDVEFVID